MHFCFSNEKHLNVVETFLGLFQIEMVSFGVLKAKPSQKFGFKTKKGKISVLNCLPSDNQKLRGKGRVSSKDSHPI